MHTNDYLCEKLINFFFQQQEMPRVETAFDTLMRISPKKPSPKKGRGRSKKGSSTDLRSKSSANLGRKHVDRDLKLHMINENSNSSDQFTEVNMRKPILTPTFCGKASISEIRPLIKVGFQRNVHSLR